MSAPALPRTAAEPLAGAGPRPLVGSGALLRFALRRDRRRLLVWVVALAGFTGYAAVALTELYPTVADRQARAAVVGTPAGILFSGPGFGSHAYTVGAMVSNEVGLTVMVAAAVMSILLVVRHTRAQEESGGAELVLSGAVGRRAPLAAALLLVGLADLGVAVGVVVALAAAGLGGADAIALAAGWALVAAVFGAVAAGTAQLFQQARAATGAALAVLGAAALVRGVGDIQHRGGGTLSWCSPIAWAQQGRAFVDLRWWPLLPLAALIAVLVAAALATAGRRDVGAGLVAARPGPGNASALLGGPLALSARLQRGSFIGWAAGVVLLGATFGSLTDQVAGMVAGNPRLTDVFAQVGASRVTDSFAAVGALYVGLCAGGFAVGSVLRMRGEESAGRLEAVLAAAVGRRRTLGAALLVTAGAALVLLLAAGVASGAAAAVATGDAARLGAGVGAALVQWPAVLVMAAATAALVGWLPRLAPAAWLLVGWSLVAGMFGVLLHLPRWATHLSPFAWVPAVPAQHADGGALLGLSLAAALLAAVALAGFRRRDVPA